MEMTSSKFKHLHEASLHCLKLKAGCKDKSGTIEQYWPNKQLLILHQLVHSTISNFIKWAECINEANCSGLLAGPCFAIALEF